MPKVPIQGHCLEFKEQRYYCEYCHFNFILKTSIVEKHCYISYNKKHAINLNTQNEILEYKITILKRKFTPLMGY